MKRAYGAGQTKFRADCRRHFPNPVLSGWPVTRAASNNPGVLIIFLALLFGTIVSLLMQNGWVWALVACTIGAVSEGFMSGTAVRARLAELRFPKGTPPLWVWSVIGTAYYILFFFVLKSLLDHLPIPYWTSIALTLSAVLLAANASWNWIFFRKKDCWLSFVFFLPYLLLAVALAVVLYRIRNPLFSWYAVYLAYLVYATWWGHRVWKLNRGLSKKVDT